MAELREPISSASRKWRGEVTSEGSSTEVVPGESTNVASDVSNNGNEIAVRDPYVSCGRVRKAEVFTSTGSASSGIDVTVNGETDRLTLLAAVAGSLK